MPQAIRSSGRRPVRSAPSNTMRPERTGSRPMMVFSSVVFPTPFRPMRQITPPAGTSSETSHSTWFSPYATFSPLTSSMRGIPTAAEVDLHHSLVLLDLVHRALAEDATLVQHGHRACDAPHELHVVLDDEHGPILGHRPKEPRRLLGLLIGHAGDGLVDEQKLGLLDDDHPDLEALLFAVAQCA